MTKLRKAFYSKLGLVTALYLTYTTLSFGQILKPVHWSYAAKKTGPMSAIILIKATIDKGWHIYSVNQPDGGPIKTSFEFALSSTYQTVGNVLEPKPEKSYSDTFKIDVFEFSRQVIFQQRIKLKATQATVKGTLTFMVCNNQKCLPSEDVEFSIPIK